MRWSDEELRSLVSRMHQETGLRVTERNWEMWRREHDAPPWATIASRMWKDHEFREWVRSLESDAKVRDRATKDLSVYLREVLSIDAYDAWAQQHGRMRASEVKAALGSIRKAMRELAAKMADQ